MFEVGFHMVIPRVGRILDIRSLVYIDLYSIHRMTTRFVTFMNLRLVPRLSLAIVDIFICSFPRCCRGVGRTLPYIWQYRQYRTLWYVLPILSFTGTPDPFGLIRLPPILFPELPRLLYLLTMSILVGQESRQQL